MENTIEIYRSTNGQVELNVQLKDETVWLTQSQITSLFERDQSVISRHINNVFKEGELEKKSNMQKMHITSSDKPVALYNLDVIISVGYRVKSQQGVQFRKWATRIIKQHLVQGYSFNQKRLETIGVDVGELMGLLQQTLSRHSLANQDGIALTRLIADYARSWTLLQAYDEQTLAEPGTRSDSPQTISEKEALNAIKKLKKELMRCGEATELFGQLRGNGLDSSLGAIEQTFGGEPLYPTINSRAAHLLYFIIKNHPFTDGNKRIGSFLFLLYLEKNKTARNTKGQIKISDNAMVPLALLVAESDPKQKELMIRLIQHLLEN